jgi:hypothetical protein
MIDGSFVDWFCHCWDRSNLYCVVRSRSTAIPVGIFNVCEIANRSARYFVVFSNKCSIDEILELLAVCVGVLRRYDFSTHNLAYLVRTVLHIISSVIATNPVTLLHLLPMQYTACLALCLSEAESFYFHEIGHITVICAVLAQRQTRLTALIEKGQTTLTPQQHKRPVKFLAGNLQSQSQSLQLCTSPEQGSPSCTLA